MKTAQDEADRQCADTILLRLLIHGTHLRRRRNNYETGKNIPLNMRYVLLLEREMRSGTRRGHT